MPTATSASPSGRRRIDRYKNTNFDSYIRDGTIIGHYMIDEPNDPANWNGRPVSGETLDDMARYSKSKWPNLPTIVRTYPDYLEKWAPYRYLDAAWAQYVERKGDVDDFIDEQRRVGQAAGTRARGRA